MSKTKPIIEAPKPKPSRTRKACCVCVRLLSSKPEENCYLEYHGEKLYAHKACAKGTPVVSVPSKIGGVR